MTLSFLLMEKLMEPTLGQILSASDLQIVKDVLVVFMKQKRLWPQVKFGINVVSVVCVVGGLWSPENFRIELERFTAIVAMQKNSDLKVLDVV
uniref:Uncharacterized protein n=1 Tax=Meloidogyne enterolobii TaxID=390850 RepID=A0A6V7XJ15_MELEN|nr:unnamed protein product [Meloidogyne enterolobii]